MTDKLYIVEAIIPATGDALDDHEILAAIKPAVDELKKVVHALAKPGTVTVRPTTRSGPRSVKPTLEGARLAPPAPTEALVLRPENETAADQRRGHRSAGE